jgi:hypothetical protein
MKRTKNVKRKFAKEAIGDSFLPAGHRVRGEIEIPEWMEKEAEIIESSGIRFNPNKKRTSEGLKIRGVSIKDMTLSRLQIAALKAFPSSPIQKEIQKEIRKRIQQGEKTWFPNKKTRNAVFHVPGKPGVAIYSVSYPGGKKPLYRVKIKSGPDAGDRGPFRTFSAAKDYALSPFVRNSNSKGVNPSSLVHSKKEERMWCTAKQYAAHSKGGYGLAVSIYKKMKRKFAHKTLPAFYGRSLRLCKKRKLR